MPDPPSNPELTLSETAIQVLGQGVAAATEAERDDLVARLITRTKRLRKPGVTLLVIGEYKQGKSSFVNALLNISYCPVDDDIATAIPTVVRHGLEISARAFVDTREDSASGDASEPTPIDVGAIASHVTSMVDEGGRRLRFVEVCVPRRLLESGLAIVDTPGVGGMSSEHGAATMGALRAADAVMFLTDASQELTRSEIELLRRASLVSRRLAVVLTKTDLYPTWRTIAELDAANLRHAEIEAPVLPVSSMLRLRAVALADSELNKQSGFGELLAWMQAEVIGRAGELAARDAARDVVDVCDQLRLQYEAQRQMLSDPSRFDVVLDNLAQMEQRATALRSGASRWQIALSDGVQDLTADVDHDLRSRFHTVIAEADARIDSADPLDIWDEFEPWLRQFVTEQVASNHVMLLERAEALGREIGRLFTEDEFDLGFASIVDDPAPVVASVGVTADLDRSNTSTVVDSTLGVLRGGYGGMLMFGMLASMIGFAMIAPVSLAVGLAMGGRHQREEKKRRLVQRRQQSRQAFRKYTDAVQFAVGKDSRDTVRQVHRELRDAWSERAQELLRSAQAALELARESADVRVADRERRLSDVATQLERIGALQSSAQVLAEGSPR